MEQWYFVFGSEVEAWIVAAQYIITLGQTDMPAHSRSR